MAKTSLTEKINDAIQSATNDFDYWVNLEQEAWKNLEHAVKVQSVQSVEQTIKTIQQAKMNKEIANGKLEALRKLTK